MQFLVEGRKIRGSRNWSDTKAHTLDILYEGLERGKVRWKGRIHKFVPTLILLFYPRFGHSRPFGLTRFNSNQRYTYTLKAIYMYLQPLHVQSRILSFTSDGNTRDTLSLAALSLSSLEIWLSTFSARIFSKRYCILRNSKNIAVVDHFII